MSLAQFYTLFETKGLKIEEVSLIIPRVMGLRHTHIMKSLLHTVVIKLPKTDIRAIDITHITHKKALWDDLFLDLPKGMLDPFIICKSKH